MGGEGLLSLAVRFNRHQMRVYDRAALFHLLKDLEQVRFRRRLSEGDVQIRFLRGGYSCHFLNFERRRRGLLGEGPIIAPLALLSRRLFPLLLDVEGHHSLAHHVGWCEFEISLEVEVVPGSMSHPSESDAKI